MYINFRGIVREMIRKNVLSLFHPGYDTDSRMEKSIEFNYMYSKQLKATNIDMFSRAFV